MGLPSLADYTPPSEDEIEKQFWIGTFLKALTILVLVVTGIVLAMFVMNAFIPTVPVAYASARQPAPDTIVITYEGGPDSGSLREISATVSSGADHQQVKKIGLQAGMEPPAIGTMLTFSGPFAGNDRVVVTGIFAGGRETVMLDTVV